jgi:hypothetical protein
MRSDLVCQSGQVLSRHAAAVCRTAKDVEVPAVSHGCVSIGFRQQSAQLPAIKAERPDVAGVYSQVLQDVLHRVDHAFGGFFARVRRGDRPGFPRFR